MDQTTMCNVVFLLVTFYCGSKIYISENFLTLSQKISKHFAINHLIHFFNTYAVVVAMQCVCLLPYPWSLIPWVTWLHICPFQLYCEKCRRRCSNIAWTGIFYFSSVEAKTTYSLSVTIILQPELIHTFMADWSNITTRIKHCSVAAAACWYSSYTPGETLLTPQSR